MAYAPYLAEKRQLDRLEGLLKAALSILAAMQRFEEVGNQLLNDDDMLDVLTDTLTAEQRQALQTIKTFTANNTATIDNLIEVLQLKQ